MKKSLSLVSVAILLFVFICACANEALPPPSVVKSKPVISEKTKICFDTVTTVGNHSYLPLNLKKEMPSDNIDLILSILNAFEKEHPEWKITNWHIEKKQPAYVTQPAIYGLWVDHEPRG